MDDFRALYDNYFYGADEAIATAPRVRIAGNNDDDKPVILDENITKPRETKNAYANLTSLGHFDAVNQANETLKQCNNKEDLLLALEKFDACPLKHTANNTIFANGFWGAEYVIITDSPALDDDKSGRHLSGPGGQLLQLAMKAVGLDLSKNCLTIPAVFWRPPGGRTPNDGELAICQPFIMKYCALFAPKRLLLLGKMAQKSVLGVESMVQNRKTTHITPETWPKQLPVYCSFSPEYCTQSPLEKRHLYADLLLFTGDTNVE